jgi:hypothetical protein
MRPRPVAAEGYSLRKDNLCSRSGTLSGARAALVREPASQVLRRLLDPVPQAAGNMRKRVSGMDNSSKI